MEQEKVEWPLCPPGKSSWPELVGTDGAKAAKIIEKENRFVKAEITYEGCPGTLDFRCDRVRVVLNCGNLVAHTPVIG